MQRVLVNGPTGSGKTTLAGEMAARLGLRHIELDALVHQAGWREASDEELKAALAPLLAEGRWVVDGNYYHKLGATVLDEADTWIWLDPPRAVLVWRVVRRSLARLLKGEELWNGNRETLKTSFIGRESLLAWAWRSSADKRRQLPQLAHGLKELGRELPLVRLRSSRDVRRFLAGLGQAAEPGPRGRTQA